MDLRKEHEKSIEIRKKHEDLIRKHDKEDNEICFLPNKEKIRYSQY